MIILSPQIFVSKTNHNIGNHDFSVAASNVWNQLLITIKSSETLATFIKNHVHVLLEVSLLSGEAGHGNSYHDLFFVFFLLQKCQTPIFGCCSPFSSQRSAPIAFSVFLASLFPSVSGHLIYPNLSPILTT